MISFGSPGTQTEVTRTIEVEASDSMRFKPATIRVKRNEVVRFVVTNIGKIAHEFSIGDVATQRAHAKMMMSMPDMKHEDDQTTITIEPGQSKTLIWKFDRWPAGPIEIGCHVPGHYEAGMRARIVLAK